MYSRIYEGVLNDIVVPLDQLATKGRIWGKFVGNLFVKVIMEYLVNISKKCAFWSLNEDILKITILKTNTPYPSRKIRRIRAFTPFNEHQRPNKGKKTNNAVSRKKSIRHIERYSNENIQKKSSTVPTQEILIRRTNPLDTRIYPTSRPRGKRAKRRHFKSLSLDELRSSDFNLFSDQEYSEEEEAEAMTKTMEKYMSKTRTDYGSGVARHKIAEKDSFEPKGQFVKKLRENTFSGSDNKDANEHIEKVLEIVDLFHVPNITVDQLMLRVFPISLTRATMEEINNFKQEPDETLYQAWESFKELLMKCPQHYLTEMQEVILFYNGLDVPTRQILDSKGAVPTKTTADAKKAI
ncbi:reverse transcriptase domain-containing protein [Tanacetum coccineum]